MNYSLFRVSSSSLLDNGMARIKLESNLQTRGKTTTREKFQRNGFSEMSRQKNKFVDHLLRVKKEWNEAGTGREGIGVKSKSEKSCRVSVFL